MISIALLAVNARAGRLNIAVNTDKSVGRCYRFWTVCVFTSQHRFTDENYLKILKVKKPFMREVNCVRMLGGREDRLNKWYQGVDENGRIKTDFTGLISSLRAMINAGYKPRLVLDNVPTAMSGSAGGEMHKYGNCNPPDDYGLWRQYITELLNALISEFGYEQVASWRIRVGTEPDNFPNHWNGTKEQYFKHYDITVDAVTRIIPDADIGPGNILNPMRPERKRKAKGAKLEGHGEKWGLDIIDHCAVGKNYVTGKTGTRMRHFSFSYYDGVGKRSFLEESIQKVRERLNRYPQFREIPIEIGEFGILRDEHRQWLWGNEITEWGASWYAAMGDIIYRNGVANAFEWSHSTNRIPHPRLHVIRMFEMMADGKRLDVKVKGKPDGRAGAIACIKDDKVFLLLYSHHPLREPKVDNTLSLKIMGSRMAKNRLWSMNEWTIDHDHGVWAYEMYRDCEAAGLMALPKSPIYGGQPQHRFGKKWFRICAQNRQKYKELAKFPQTVVEKPVAVCGRIIALKYNMPGHSVKLIELAPVK